MIPTETIRADKLPIDIDRAIETFVRGFCFTRSITHPYVAERIQSIWVTRDARRTSGDHRNEEWISHAVTPHEINRLARMHAEGRYACCPIVGVDESEEPIRSGFKKLNYRLKATEPLMIHRLRKIDRIDSPAKIERVRTRETADRLAKAARSRQILPEHLKADAPLRQYVGLVEDELAGWVRSIPVGDSTWCSNMYVAPKFRRRGIAKAMLCRMLRDDREDGSTLAVLTASHTGAKLYNAVGYEQIGTLLAYTPAKR